MGVNCHWIITCLIFFKGILLTFILSSAVFIIQGGIWRLKQHKFLFPIFMPWSYISAFRFHSKYQSSETFWGTTKLLLHQCDFLRYFGNYCKVKVVKISNKKVVLYRPVLLKHKLSRWEYSAWWETRGSQRAWEILSEVLRMSFWKLILHGLNV